MAWKRVIVHADMDAFYAAVEQLDNPELRGKPLLIGGTGRRSVVCTASYEARPFGVGSAMPMVTARRKCPQAIVVPPRMHRYAEVSHTIMGVFKSFSPRVEPLSFDEAFLDMSDDAVTYVSPGNLGRKLKRAVADATGGLRVSVGIADTKQVAKLASDYRKPDGLTVVRPERVRGFLDPLPVRRLWGVGPATEKRLLALGLETVGQVFRADPMWLEARLGRLGDHLYRLAANLDPRPVKARRRRKSIGAERTLEYDVRGAEAILPLLQGLAERVAGSLRKRGCVARGVRVKLKTHRFQNRTRQALLGAASNDDDTIFAQARALLERFDLDVPMRLVGLSVYRVQKAQEGGLFAEIDEDGVDAGDAPGEDEPEEDRE